MYDVYVSPGNRAMKIPTFSLPSVKKCKGKTKHCEKYCYAKKAERLYKKVLPRRKRNYKASRKGYFVWMMINAIEKKKCNYLRIHESGDFYNQTYLNKWIAICETFPEKTFLAYTQMYRLDYSKCPKNMVIYFSVWDDSKKVPDGGLHAYVKDNGKGKIGEYNIPKNIKECPKQISKDITCDKCLYCFRGKGDVVFKLH